MLKNANTSITFANLYYKNQYHQKHKQKIIGQLKPEYLFCDWHSLPRWGHVRNPWGQLVVYECTDPVVANRLVKQGVNLIETFAIGEMIRGEHMDALPPWA